MPETSRPYLLSGNSSGFIRSVMDINVIVDIFPAIATNSRINYRHNLS